MTISMSSRKFQLVQVGESRLPALDMQTELSFATRLVQTDTEMGGQHDYYANRFSPLGVGTVKHSGLFPLCDTNTLGIPDDIYYRNEIDRLQMARSIWTPFLFYSNIYVPPVNRGIPAPDAGKYLWAYGKITQLSNIATIIDHTRSSRLKSGIQRAAPLDIAATLKSPLVPVTYSRWRYGVAFSMPVGRRTLLADMESANAEPVSHWYVPGTMPLWVDNGERFWPRNLFNEDLFYGTPEYDPAKWECPYLTITGAANEFIIVSGNTQPRTRVVMTGDSYFTIRNYLGTFVFNYQRPLSSAIYCDSWSGIVMEKTINGDMTPVPSAGWPPQLAWSDNVVTVVNGAVTIGQTEAWVN